MSEDCFCIGGAYRGLVSFSDLGFEKSLECGFKFGFIAGTVSSTEDAYFFKYQTKIPNIIVVYFCHSMAQ